MTTSDRLRELACECQDSETRLERLVAEVERLEGVRRAALELAEALEFVPLDAKADARLLELRALT